MRAAWRREIESRFLDDGSAAERGCWNNSSARSAPCQGSPRGGEPAQHVHQCSSSPALVDQADHALLWDWAKRTVVSGRRPLREVRLAGGTRVSAECEPVRFGTDTVGALIHLVIGPSAVEQHSPRPRAPQRTFGLASLSAAQLGTAELVASGLTNREAATRLYVSRHTVDFHLRQIFNKLGINSRVELARLVAEHRAERRSDREDAA